MFLCSFFQDICANQNTSKQVVLLILDTSVALNLKISEASIKGSVKKLIRAIFSEYSIYLDVNFMQACSCLA